MSQANDFHRPRYHYMPTANWMNDPNGAIQWRGHYHLFYQYNPDGAYHANMHWGHAVSDDMIHWDELPIALAPTPNSYDQGGIFSGCMVDNDGVPTALYTGVNDNYSVQVQCMAMGSPDLLTWEKSDSNPIVASVPSEMGQTSDFRDPFVWREGDVWYMVIGSRIDGVGGAILLYRSNNLVDWEYIHPLFIGDKARNGIMFECPNFFQLGDKWVLIISAILGNGISTVLYWVGRYREQKFIPEHEGVLDNGYYYAPLSHVDEQGRRILWAWLREGRSVEQQRAAGWSGVQAIPRILTLDEQHRLLMTPVPEVEQLRTVYHHFTADTLPDDILPVAGLSLDIQVTFTTESDNICGIEVACSADGQEKTIIYYDVPTETLRVVRRYAMQSDEVETNVQGSIHRLTSNERLDLRILLDGSVLEIIANQRTSITCRFYPTYGENQHIRVLNASSVESLDVWELSVTSGKVESQK